MLQPIYSRRTYLISIVKQLVYSRLKVKKCIHHLLYADVINFFVTRKCQKTRKIDENVNIEQENLHIFQTTWGTSMKFSGKTWLNIKIHEKTRLHPLSRKYKFGKSYNYCKNLKRKLSKIFAFSILGIGQNRKVGNFRSFLFFLFNPFHNLEVFVSVHFCRFWILSCNCQNLK